MPQVRQTRNGHTTARSEGSRAWVSWGQSIAGPPFVRGYLRGVGSEAEERELPHEGGNLDHEGLEALVERDGGEKIGNNDRGEGERLQQHVGDDRREQLDALRDLELHVA